MCKKICLVIFLVCLAVVAFVMPRETDESPLAIATYLLVIFVMFVALALAIFGPALRRWNVRRRQMKKEQKEAARLLQTAKKWWESDERIPRDRRRLCDDGNVDMKYASWTTWVDLPVAVQKSLAEALAFWEEAEHFGY